MSEIKVGQYYRHKRDRDILQIIEIKQRYANSIIIDDPNGVWTGGTHNPAI